jgi:hypothetical protein
MSRIPRVLRPLYKSEKNSGTINGGKDIKYILDDEYDEGWLQRDFDLAR